MSHSTRSRTVTLRHATPRRNVRSILGRGLLPAMAKGKLAAVWLHVASEKKTAWARAHVAKRHRVPVSQVVILEVRVPRSALRRRKSGIWTTATVILPEAIISTNGLKLVG